MKNTKKRSKKMKLNKKIDTGLLRDVVVFVFLVVAFYTVMHVVVNSGGSRDCAASQEIEAGCQTEQTFNTIFLLPSIVLAGLLLAGLKRMSEIKHHARKTHQKARKVLE